MQKYSADVVIAGAGLAGLTTAIELIEQGKSVILLDRDSESNLGGLAKKSFGGILLAGTPHQKKTKIPDSPELAYNDWVRYGELENAEELILKWVRFYTENNIPYIFEWLDEKKVGFLPLVNWPERGMHIPGNSVPRWHITWGTGLEIINRVVDFLENHEKRQRLQIFYRHKVERLNSKGGAVTGFSGIIDENRARKFKAEGEAVVIASGGICGDLKMVKKHWDDDLPPAPKQLVNGGHRFGDGTLHKAAEKAGARLTNLNRHWHYAAGISHPEPAKENDGLSLVPPRGALWVNARGEKIGPAPLVGYTDTRYLVENILKEPGGYSWQIMNRKIAEKELAVSGSQYMTAFTQKKKLKMILSVLFGNKELVNRLLTESEDFIAADSLSELVNKMNTLEKRYRVDYDTLAEAVEQFDADMHLGEKYITSEQKRRIHAFRTYRGDKLRMTKFQPLLDKKAGPLIAVREFILTRKSLGGIRTDLNCRVLNDKDEPVENLFAVGEAAGFGGGGIHGKRSLEGTFLGGCILTGRMAANYINGGNP